MHLQLNCPSCNSEIRAEDINIDKVLAKCAQCNAVFNFEKVLRQPSHKRQEVLLPVGIESFQTNFELDFEINWRKTSKGLGFFLFFTLFWNGIVGIFVVAGLATGQYGMLLGISIHLLIGIGLLYYVLATMLNTTYITVGHRELTVEHRPLRFPFYPNRYLPISDIEQVFIERYVASKSNNSPNFAFRVKLIDRNKKRIDLIKGLKHPDQALYIEQEIEKFLKIQDQHVEEEWKG
ncbi:MAG: hypothetical protein DHS20C18_41660 [Saprospiraceae bacterium]|nr:MAG: hypothetical protein DHS20C18_41660 [Saprospiraceae bacterium]